MFLSCPGCPSRSCSARSTARDSVLSCCAVQSSDACQGGRLRCITWFPCVLVEVLLGLFRARFCCCRATSESEVCCWFGWCVLEGFSQSGALVVLVEVCQYGLSHCHGALGGRVLVAVR
ncbi:hypothetical protein Taro_045332 [Colocasia esculenta]|uniref:Uncharacterized protein n=1 Tax=Colocasia esculenta TaxID=4460 RepID=A0A843X419_COLES|nr:hypothetical protein [Colocasia esculenta]